MKDIVLKGSSVKRELWILLISFGLAMVVNICSILIYETAWIELFTSMGFVAILTVVFYVLAGLCRLLIEGLRTLIKFI
ncbi:hypothetical protein [Saccharicrinis fermentans]|uniref:Uncharacterized protein n=1 Tax=Saccharicrinis fermentans DSM 9555 = JCM 21142 TaxID=869213 RepID=W7Y3V9_9BACT|nr:hypothetical protein [Saccharicrinis fermentans]GAF02268.1 hypothetical protein JCM21142_3897 [Saccharicrinis fermentans DSM 9555 = JCM 21142]